MEKGPPGLADLETLRRAVKLEGQRVFAIRHVVTRSWCQRVVDEDTISEHATLVDIHLVYFEVQLRLIYLAIVFCEFSPNALEHCFVHANILFLIGTSSGSRHYRQVADSMAVPKFMSGLAMGSKRLAFSSSGGRAATKSDSGVEPVQRRVSM